MLDSVGQAYTRKDTALYMAKRDIQIASDEIRSDYIPRSPYQIWIYDEKVREADRYQEQVDFQIEIDESEYPYLKGEVGYTVDPLNDSPSSDMAGVARAIRKKRDLYNYFISPAIEGVRIKLVAEVERKNVDDTDYLDYVTTKARSARMDMKVAVKTAKDMYDKNN